jgi:hypothetical protein
MLYVFTRFSETTKRVSKYEVVANGIPEAREKLARRHGQQVAREAQFAFVLKDARDDDVREV